jgi:hypothetical protein
LRHFSATGVTRRYVHIDEALRMADDKVAEEIRRILSGDDILTALQTQTFAATASANQ